MKNFFQKKSIHAVLVLVFVSALLVVSSAFFVQKNWKASSEKHPNILVILTDQWEGRTLGYLGREQVRTPHLNALAKEGLTLTHMVSNYPLCSPARAMLMTGTYPVKNKVISNSNSASAPFGVALPVDMV